MANIADRSAGPYRLLSRIARGGMGELYVGAPAEFVSLDHLVAVKVLRPSLMTKPDYVSMFLDESQISLALRHPNICHVRDLGRTGNTYYIAMELLQGASMLEVLTASSALEVRLDVGFVGGLFVQLLSGLDHAHKLRSPYGRPLGLVHRDLSPSNVYLTTCGVAKVLDFGIASYAGRMTHTVGGIIKGKYSYMSPEQTMGEPMDARSDVFSAGILLWESLTGGRLFHGASAPHIVRAIHYSDIPRVDTIRSDCPVIVADTVARALERDPDKRFDCAGSFRDALAAALELRRFRPAGLVSVLNELLGDKLAHQSSQLRGLLIEHSDGDPRSAGMATEVMSVVDYPGT